MFASRRFSSWLQTILLAAVAANALDAIAAAQCPQPDNLDGGPCCTQTAEDVPWFKKFKLDSLSICWRDCGIDAIGPLVAQWTPIKPIPIKDDLKGFGCGHRLWRLDLEDLLGVRRWSGTMTLVYSRTWMELSPAPVGPLQVWRFLVNGDLKPTPAVGAAPCPLPPCAAAFGKVKFSGYIDFAKSCAGAAPLQTAWMLTHACDSVDHAPGFPRGGAFHPGRSYTFVGPSAGFVPAPVVAAEGTAFSPLEAVRRILLPAPGTSGLPVCEFEEPFSHSMTTALFCSCAGGLPLNPQWVLGTLTGAGACGTGIVTPGAPFLPGFLSMGIGSWTVAGAYPGLEDLRWNAGGYRYTDPCAGSVLDEVFFGVTTLGGYPAVQVTAGGPGAALPLIFIDQSNSRRLAGGTVMNIPYSSDHVLNLNE